MKCGYCNKNFKDGEVIEGTARQGSQKYHSILMELSDGAPISCMDQRVSKGDASVPSTGKEVFYGNKVYSLPEIDRRAKDKKVDLKIGLNDARTGCQIIEGLEALEL